MPVKRLEAAKSRLRGALTDADHEALVLAMALDTVAAALASPVVGRVVVVTGDPARRRGRGARGRGDRRRTRRRPQPGARLRRRSGPPYRRHPNAARRRRAHGRPARTAHRRPDRRTAPGRRGARPLAVHAGTAEQELRHRRQWRSAPYCSRRRPRALLEPCFGPGSAAAHARQRRGRVDRTRGRACAATWTPRPISPRRFVLGVGARTAVATQAASAHVSPAIRSEAEAAVVRQLQGTVATFDESRPPRIVAAR